MKVAVLGTGVVGRTLGGKVASLGHDVTIGTRDVDSRSPEFSDWLEDHPTIPLARFADAAAAGEIVFNATNGAVSVEVLRAAGSENLSGKIIIDVSNPLDFSAGFPPTLLVSNTDSLGEQLQRAFPEAKVVKTLNTVNANVMIDPAALAGGDHHVFLSGDDPQAKDEVADLLRRWFGWKQILDLGDITTARGVEMYLALWVRLMSPIGSPTFNIKIAT